MMGAVTGGAVSVTVTVVMDTAGGGTAGTTTSAITPLNHRWRPRKAARSRLERYGVPIFCRTDRAHRFTNDQTSAQYVLLVASEALTRDDFTSLPSPPPPQPEPERLRSILTTQSAAKFRLFPPETNYSTGPH